MISVCPSGAARATCSAASAPPAPGRFTTTSGTREEGRAGLRDRASDDVAAAARREADDELDRPRGLPAPSCRAQAGAASAAPRRTEHRASWASPCPPLPPPRVSPEYVGRADSGRRCHERGDRAWAGPGCPRQPPRALLCLRVAGHQHGPRGSAGGVARAARRSSRPCPPRSRPPGGRRAGSIARKKWPTSSGSPRPAACGCGSARRTRPVSVAESTCTITPSP